MQTNRSQRTSPRIRAYRQAPWRIQTRILAVGLGACLDHGALEPVYFRWRQGAEAGLRVQSLIHQRDQLLRTYLRRRRTGWAAIGRILHKRALELGFQPATPRIWISLISPGRCAGIGVR